MQPGNDGTLATKHWSSGDQQITAGYSLASGAAARDGRFDLLFLVLLGIIAFLAADRHDAGEAWVRVVAVAAPACGPFEAGSPEIGLEIPDLPRHAKMILRMISPRKRSELARPAPPATLRE